MDDNEGVQYPVEFLNLLEHTGIPTHMLKLKVGSHHDPQIYRPTQDHKWNQMCCNLASSKPHISCGPFKEEVVLPPKIP